MQITTQNAILFARELNPVIANATRVGGFIWIRIRRRRHRGLDGAAPGESRWASLLIDFRCEDIEIAILHGWPDTIVRGPDHMRFPTLQRNSRDHAVAAHA